MSGLLILQPLAIVSVAASRGTGADNLRSVDPKEVWADGGSGSTVRLTIDLGVAAAIDTILLGYVRAAVAATTWAISGGLAGPSEFAIAAAGTLRVPDIAGAFADPSHALWTGAARTVRYLQIEISQPASASAITAGVLVVGRAFAADLGQEWGAGRQPIDTGSATSLPSGGFAVVQGARKRLFSWAFGDLSSDETDRIEQIALSLGETSPGVVIEDPTQSAGLAARIHYGLFRRWTPFERRNRRQTRWEISIEEWI